MNACKKTSLLFLFILLHEIALFALPEGTVSVQGGGSVGVTGKNMIVEAPDGSIFEHQSFKWQWTKACNSTNRRLNPSA